MTPITLTLELHHNNRVVRGLYKREDHFVDDFEFAITPGSFPGKDIVQVTLGDIDLGRFDSEGDDYLCEWLEILPGDLIGWQLEGV